jgi:hypothetical protein
VDGISDLCVSVIEVLQVPLIATIPLQQSKMSDEEIEAEHTPSQDVFQLIEEKNTVDALTKLLNSYVMDGYEDEMVNYDGCQVPDWYGSLGSRFCWELGISTLLYKPEDPRDHI